MTVKAPPEKLTTPLWRNYDFLLLISGQSISTLGSGISTIAFPLLMLFVTGSPAQAGFATAIHVLPFLIFSLPAGALVDRWNRKHLMIICDTGRALALGSIPLALWLGHLSVIQLYLVSLIDGTLFVFFGIAQAACLPQVVAKEQLPGAAAANEASFYTATFLSPTLGGLLYQFQRALPFLADGISYAVSVISLLFIKVEFQGKRAAKAGRLRDDILEGLRWLGQQKIIRLIALLTGGSNLIESGIPLILIILAQKQHAQPSIIGTIFSIAAVGGIIGSLLGGKIQKRLTVKQVIIGTFWIETGLLSLYLIAPNPIFLGIITAGVFFVGPIYNVVQFSYRLSLIPDELQGRVNSAFRLLAICGSPLGVALAGILLQKFDVAVTIIVFVALYLILAILATLILRSQRIESSKDQDAISM